MVEAIYDLLFFFFFWHWTLGWMGTGMDLWQIQPSTASRADMNLFSSVLHVLSGHSDSVGSHTHAIHQGQQTRSVTHSSRLFWIVRDLFHTLKTNARLNYVSLAPLDFMVADRLHCTHNFLGVVAIIFFNAKYKYFHLVPFCCLRDDWS